MTANRETLRAGRLALDGVVQERDVGQRTTLDVLNAQNTVLNAQIALARLSETSVVSSYALLSAIGRLTARDLGLRVALHDPKEHYTAVKDKWFGCARRTGVNHNNSSFLWVEPAVDSAGFSSVGSSAKLYR